MVTQKPIDGTHKTHTGKWQTRVVDKFRTEGFFVGVWVGGAVVFAVYLVLKLIGAL